MSINGLGERVKFSVLLQQNSIEMYTGCLVAFYIMDF